MDNWISDTDIDSDILTECHDAEFQVGALDCSHELTILNGWSVLAWCVEMHFRRIECMGLESKLMISTYIEGSWS